MGKEQYISLITKQLSNELSTAELGELSAWISGGSDRQNIASDFKEVWNSVSNYKASVVFDPDSAFDSFLNKYDLNSDVTLDYEPSMAPLLRYILVGVTTLALIFGAYNLVNKVSGLTENVEHMANTSDKTITVALSNGATALLEPGSEFTYDKNRSQVGQIEGGALFDLAHLNKKQSMNFNVNGLSFEGYQNKLELDFDKENHALKTELVAGNLNLNLYGEDLELKEGDVLSVNTKEKSFDILKPQSKPSVIINKDTKTLTFSNTPIAKVFEAIEDYYEVNINVKGTVPDVHFTAINLINPELDDCLELVKESIPMDIKMVAKDKFVVSNIKK